METDFHTYRKFISEKEALNFIDFLTDENIPFRFRKSSYLLDPNIIGVPLESPFWVEIPLNEFQRLNYILNEKISNSFQLVDLKKDPLYTLNNEELIQILQHKDQWSVESTVVARQILLNRNIDVESFEGKRENATNAFLQRTTNKTEWIVYGCIIVMVTYFYLVVGLLITVAMYLYYSTSRETLITGKRPFVFNLNTRKIAWIYFAFFGLGLIIKFIWGQ